MLKLDYVKLLAKYHHNQYDVWIVTGPSSIEARLQRRITLEKRFSPTLPQAMQVRLARCRSVYSFHTCAEQARRDTLSTHNTKSRPRKSHRRIWTQLGGVLPRTASLGRQQCLCCLSVHRVLLATSSGSFVFHETSVLEAAWYIVGTIVPVDTYSFG